MSRPIVSLYSFNRIRRCRFVNVLIKSQDTDQLVLLPWCDLNGVNCELSVFHMQGRSYPSLFLIAIHMISIQWGLLFLLRDLVMGSHHSSFHAFTCAEGASLPLGGIVAIHDAHIDDLLS